MTPDLVQKIPKPLELSQGFGCSAAAVQSKHELPPSSLSKRLSFHCIEQIREELQMLAKPELAFNLVFVGDSLTLVLVHAAHPVSRETQSRRYRTYRDTHSGQTWLGLTEEDATDDAFEELTFVVIAVASIHRRIALNHGPCYRAMTFVRFELAFKNPVARPAAVQKQPVMFDE